jgi:hypothetical protein
MKRIIWALVSCLFTGLTVSGQSSLGIDTANGAMIYVTPTSFLSTDPLILTIKNYGPQPYTGVVTVNYALDSSGTGNMLGLISLDSNSVAVTNLQVNGGFMDSASLFINDTSALYPFHFRSGINTVVIWPRSGSGDFITQDSAKINILVSGYAGISNPVLHITQKIFPNPAKQELFVSNNDPKFVIEQVRIFTSEGKLAYEEKYRGKIDLARLLPGIYFIELASKEGKTNRYKLIKE